MQVEQYDGAIGGEVSRRVMAIRLATGLVQGLLLYWLYRAASGGLWPATAPYLFIPLLTLAMLLPPVFNSSLGHMAPRKVALWTASAGAILLVLALYEAWRSAGVVLPGHGNSRQIALHLSSVLLLVFSGVFLYIAHVMVLAGTQDGKRIAGYGSYFEIAWKLAVQLLFSAFFVGALWAVLGMGAGLFEMVKLDFLKRLLVESWFAVPVICFAFACGLHITDVRPAIVRGIRTLLLVLASWILPVAVVIIGGFLCTLPFTGLEALWKTRYATVLLLVTVAVLVMLINAAFQNGQTAATLAIRISARMAAILLLPLTGIAIYALGLRVYEYGWTADRIYAAACLMVASCYAIGYQWAAHRYETWLVEIAPINVGTAFVVLAVLLALFTPIADPARLAVNNQVARLEKGLIKADQFDYLYLRFEGQRYGQAALERLARQGVGTQPGVVGKTAGDSLKLAGRPGFRANVAAATPASIAANVTVWPASDALPESFLRQDWKLTPEFNLPECLQRADQKCDALLFDADGDGQRDVLLIRSGYDGGYLFAQQERGQGAWRLAARMKGVHCKERLDDLRSGHYKVVTPRWKALEAGGVQLMFEPEANVSDCREEQQ
jgi:hypothetical protein